MTTPIDPEVFSQLLELEDPDDPGFVDEMIDMFLAETPGIIVRITDSLAEGDAPAVLAASHKLKGTAGLIGALAVAEFAGAIETAAREATLDSVGADLISLEAEYLQVCDYFAANADRTKLAA